MKVFGVVGWKNNGKTTLVERLISQLTSMGYKVSSVKHAHHNVILMNQGVIVTVTVPQVLSKLFWPPSTAGP